MNLPLLFEPLRQISGDFVRAFKQSLAAFFFFSAIAVGQHPIIHTESALTLGRGKAQAGAGIEYLRKNIPPPPDFPQSVLRVFVIGWHQGVSENVNFDLDWLGGLSATFQNGTQQFDWGDLTVSTKITFFREKNDLPSVGVRTAVKLPNTSYVPSRLGSNEMDFHSFLLLTKSFGDIEARFNFRFSIVGHPEVAGVQDDVYGFEAALFAPLLENFKVFAELHGFTGYQDHNSKLLGRFGGFLQDDNYLYGIYGSLRAAGDNQDFANSFDASENWSIGIAIVRSLSLSIFD
jgi:hypothetical protein